MAVEHALAHALPKPWGVEDLHPWSSGCHDGRAIGEIWYERPGQPVADPALLLKLLFTNQPLSIQVHPDDVFAHSMGLPRGKTEAWYIVSAAPGAKVALGLKRRLTSERLREAIGDGSISDLVRWWTVLPGDVVIVPSGTIHSIGAGLVIAEIQQRSDVTFRLFDHGRQRELHIERAIEVADAGPADFRVIPNLLTDSRTLLASNAHFVFERFDLAPNSAWSLKAERETWLLVLSGDGRVGLIDAATGDAIFAQADCVDICAGAAGMVALAAYTGGGPEPQLLRPIGQRNAVVAPRPGAELPAAQEKAALTSDPLETAE
jgi:mannose-6-phosphate isomerase